MRSLIFFTSFAHDCSRHSESWTFSGLKYLEEADAETHYSKSIIFVQKMNFDITLLFDIFEFLRQNWKIFLDISFWNVSNNWVFVPKILILTQNWTYKILEKSQFWSFSMLINFIQISLHSRAKIRNLFIFFLYSKFKIFCQIGFKKSNSKFF